MKTAQNDAATDQRDQAPITDGYRYYVLGVLVVVYIVNFLDRQVLSILLEPIKEDLQLKDWQLGLLGGIAFAIFYTFCGIPLARLADRVSRRNLLSVCLVLWSGMTVLAGFAQNFMHLMAARIGVAVGEAGASPTSHSIISDLFPENKRATALSIYALGIPFGTLLGFALGGVLAAQFGWRMAFVLVGAPGIALAVFMMLTVREPPRGTAVASMRPVPLAEAVLYLFRRRAFIHLSIAGGLASFTGYGNAAWIPSLLARIHEVPVDERGYIMAFLGGAVGAVGTFLGGWLADRFVAARSEKRWYVWLPALGQLLGLPPILFAFMVDDLFWFVLAATPAYVLGSLWLGPSFALGQNIATPRMRAFASSILLFVVNIIGLGVGVFAIGLLSDLLAPSFGLEAIRYALFWITLVITLWAILHFVLAGLSLRKDLYDSGEA